MLVCLSLWFGYGWFKSVLVSVFGKCLSVGVLVSWMSKCCLAISACELVVY